MEEKIVIENKSVAGSNTVSKATRIGSSIGFIAGLGYAFKGKKGFWAYVGYGLLGSIVFGTVSAIGADIITE